MLDFAHDDRLLPRLASPKAPPVVGRFSLTPTDFSSREIWLQTIRAQIACGEYLTDVKLDKALDVMLDAKQETDADAGRVQREPI